MEHVTFLIKHTQESVKCLLNPEKLEIRRVSGVKQNRQNSISQDTNNEASMLDTGAGTTDITMSLLFDSSYITRSSSTLDIRNYTQRLWKLTENHQVTGQQQRTPTVNFMWGKAWNIRGVITEVSEKLENFSVEGIPRRSWVQLTFRKLDKENIVPTTLSEQLRQQILANPSDIVNPQALADANSPLLQSIRQGRQSLNLPNNQIQNAQMVEAEFQELQHMRSNLEQQADDFLGQLTNLNPLNPLDSTGSLPTSTTYNQVATLQQRMRNGEALQPADVAALLQNDNLPPALQENLSNLHNAVTAAQQDSARQITQNLDNIPALPTMQGHVMPEGGAGDLPAILQDIQNQPNNLHLLGALVTALPQIAQRLSHYRQDFSYHYSELRRVSEVFCLQKRRLEGLKDIIAPKKSEAQQSEEKKSEAQKSEAQQSEEKKPKEEHQPTEVKEEAKEAPSDDAIGDRQPKEGEQHASRQSSIEKPANSVRQPKYELPNLPQGERPQPRNVLPQVRLDHLAYQHYGDPAYWRVLTRFNNLDHPLELQDDTPLRIPPIQKRKRR